MPDIVKSYFKEGQKALEAGEVEDAIRIFKSLVKEEQNNAGFVRQLAHAYAMRGWRNKAITPYEKALTLDEDNISLWLGLIECYLEGKEFDQARKIILAGLEVSNKKGQPLPVCPHHYC